MMRGTFQHVGDGFDAAMRMHREAADGTLDGIVEGEMIEEQEGIEFVADARRNGTAQLHACAFNRGLRFDGLRDRSKVVHACMDEVRGRYITFIYLLWARRPLPRS